ncbi:hypothetical protein RN629_14745 [Sphingomonadaceae bacterium jetA1]|jgi:hypothetical protein|uniref:hypothetical protein n=1 Tax=Facivitalis istanbulensis TaxID=3075838 RepID=UPI00348971FB
MNIFTKSLIGLTSVVAFQTAAVAATITSPAGTPVTASGQLTQDLNGNLTTVCNLTFTGTVDADQKGMTFTSYTGTKVGSGLLACDDGLVLPLHVEATSPTSVTIKGLTVSTRLGDCGPADVVGSYSGGVAGPLYGSLPGTSGVLAAIHGECHASGSLTLSPAIVIN